MGSGRTGPVVTGRQQPWILAEVAWSGQTKFIRGYYDGLPLLSWNIADRTVLATRRQLRRQGLRPGGADPVAVLYFWSGKGLRLVHADLFLIERAKPVRPMTAGKYAAIEAALAARRVCPECGMDGGDYIRPTVGMCEACQYTHGAWEATDARHDWVIGEPTLTPEQLATLTPHGPASVISFPANQSHCSHPQEVAA